MNRGHPRRHTATERTLEVLERGRDSLADVDILVEAAMWGFAYMHNKHEQYLDQDEWRAYCDDKQLPFTVRWRLDLAMEQTAEQAKKGFPLFLGMSAISIASILESTVHDFARRWLRDHRPSWEVDAVRRIELSATAFAAMSHADRSETLFNQLEQSLRGPSYGRTIRPGVEPHQRLLGVLGIAPELDGDVTAGINELVAVRNQLLHHGGRITPRFATLCPRLAKRNTKVTVSHDMFALYISTTREYLERVLRAAATVANIQLDSSPPAV